MRSPEPMVLLIDVDNTLLDNDLIRLRLGEILARQLGRMPAERFWEVYEAVREETGLVDFPLAIARFRAEYPEHREITRLEQMVFGFPFADVVYAEARPALRHAQRLGRPVILSDGDQNFQRHKIRAAGIEHAVNGHVLVYVHKELNTDEIMRRYPAEHYVMIDDKQRIHLAMKERLGERITTIHVCQGKYAHDPAHHDMRGADLTIEGIGGLRELDAAAIRRAARIPVPAH
jgi:FMN phosphatase YigB (HAD superfamily)